MSDGDAFLFCCFALHTRAFSRKVRTSVTLRFFSAQEKTVSHDKLTTSFLYIIMLYIVKKKKVLTKDEKVRERLRSTLKRSALSITVKLNGFYVFPGHPVTSRRCFVKNFNTGFLRAYKI